MTPRNQALDKEATNPIPTAATAHQGEFPDAKRARMLQLVSQDRRKALPVFQAAYKGKSLRAAVDGKCLECCWLQIIAIRECNATECPLWVVRPYQPETKSN